MDKKVLIQDLADGLVLRRGLPKKMPMFLCVRFLKL